MSNSENAYRGDFDATMFKHLGKSCFEMGCATITGEPGSYKRTEPSPSADDPCVECGKPNDSSFDDRCADCRANASETSATTINEETPVQATPNAASNAFDAFAAVLAPMIEGKINAKVDADEVRSIVADAIKDFPRIDENAIASLVATEVAKYATTRIEIVEHNAVVRTIDGAHESLKTLIYRASKRQSVYLYGPAGSGKSTGAHMAAAALGLRFGLVVLNAQSQASLLLGFKDANGTYRDTQFRDFYENGGLFCIDEADNATGNLLTTINTALANGHMAFPDGLVTRHKDFVCVATGNTAGRGASRVYADRRAFDGAFADRFAFLAWNYDEKMERAAAMAINPDCERWIAWVQAVRAYSKSAFPHLVVSPRATFAGASDLMDGVLGFKEIAEALIFKGLEESQSRQLLNACKY